MNDQHHKMMLKHKANVDRCGSSLVGVFPCKDTDKQESFTYSMGFANQGFPDVIIIGNLKQETAMYLLNSLLVNWNENGYQLGERWDVIEFKGGGKAPVHIKPLKLDMELVDEYTTQTAAFYSMWPEYDKRGDEVPAMVQLVWPDDKQKLPWDAEYNHTDFEQKVFQGNCP